MKTQRSEISETERRRRLASVYRLLIELGQRGNAVTDDRSDGQEPAGEQPAANV
ncbi:MAG: hypothetical protein JXA93_21540 [Anaerolineae bacterium]|nr:hypothetical protein [Anaerolineae bacterium]